jgi:polar amino acid transport system ATP-binding protein
MNMLMIDVHELVKEREGCEVLCGVSLAVNRGEVAAVIGQSGSGKSTFLRCLNGLEDFQRGSITIDGIRLDETTSTAARAVILRQICRRVGMVFQSFNLFPHRTVLQNIVEAPVCVLRLSRDRAEARARALLERVGLVAKLQAMPRELSGGEKQRVAIARALAMEPQAILFDEPTSALDPGMTGEVLAVMTSLARDGLTMIVVTHDMRFARQVAHTVHVFDGGRIVESGPPAQIFEDPQHVATRKLVRDATAA